MTTSQPVPRVLISGGSPSLSVPPGLPLRLHAEAHLSACFPAELADGATMRFQWTAQGGGPVPRWERAGPLDQTLALQFFSSELKAGWASTPPGGWGRIAPAGWDSINRTGRVLYLPGSSLVAGENYSLTVSAYVESGRHPHEDGVLAASADVQLLVRQPSVHATINGCDRMVHRDETVTLIVDTERFPAGDGWRHVWLCMPSPCAVNGSDLERSLLVDVESGHSGHGTEATLTFDANDLHPAAANLPLANFTFVFVAQSSTGLERVHDVCELQFAHTTAPSLHRFPSDDGLQLRIHPVDAPTSTGRHNPGAHLVLRGELAVRNGTQTAGVAVTGQGALLEWSAFPPVSGMVIGWRGGELILPAGSLGGGGGVYTFWLHARHAAGEAAAAGASLTIEVNEPPQHVEGGGGALSVSPRIGEALATAFSLRAAGWSDVPDDLPLSYRFEQLYGTAHASAPSVAPLADKSLARILTTSLPPGCTAVRVVVSDVHGCNAEPAEVRLTVRGDAHWVDAAARSTRSLAAMQRAIAVGAAAEALALGHAVGISLANFTQGSDPRISELHPAAWYRAELLNAQVLGLRVSDASVATLPPPDSPEGDSTQVPVAMQREEWAAWRLAGHAPLRAQLITALVDVSRLHPPSEVELLMHALSLDAALSSPSELSGRHDTLQLGLAHAEWLLSQSRVLGLPADLQAPLANALSHLLSAIVSAPLLYALSAPGAEGTPALTPRFHWPLLIDGREEISRSAESVVSLVPDSWHGAPRQVAAFAGRAEEGVSYARLPVTGLSFAALSVTAWVRVGRQMADWVSLWSFGAPDFFRCDLSNSGDAQLWSDTNPTARVSSAYGSPQLTLRDGRWHHLAAVYDQARKSVALYVDGLRLRGTYSGADGARFSPQEGALEPRELAIGHSPWSHPRAVTDVRIADVKLWNGVLSQAHISEEVAAAGGSSPPPPPPSPPPPDGAQFAPETASKALGRAKLSSAALVGLAVELGRQVLTGAAVGESPRGFSSALIRGSLQRHVGLSLAGASLSLSLPHAAAPTMVRLPASLQLSVPPPPPQPVSSSTRRRSLAAAQLNGLDYETLDVLLVSYGVDLYAWRSDGAYAAHAISDVVSLLVFDSAGSAVRLATPSEPLRWDVPITSAQPWRDDDIPNPTSRDAVGSNASGANTSADAQCYGWPAATCNRHGQCTAGRCACQSNFVDQDCRRAPERPSTPALARPAHLPCHACHACRLAASHIRRVWLCLLERPLRSSHIRPL